ncbi:hypothetical protein [Clostridium tarantellae]|uniref:hypothetical protein n=1 Tax=Clostridium tarantellae TaxID=39493 RepID=UPI001478F6FD|nr:hypothetical protein [Clostridium tarantellae]
MGYSYIVNEMERKAEKEAIFQKAKNLLDEFDDKVISDTTGLSLEEIAKLRRKRCEE